MKIHFNDSLPALVKVAVAQGVPMDGQTLIIRDGDGRLILGRTEVSDEARLEKALRDALGGYAGNVVVITGGLAERLLADPAIPEVEIEDESGTHYTVRYGDRRIVGVDWLHAPEPPSSDTRRLVFGSLKGGVGRSTALAVLAADLARAGKRVLVIDLDIEAPGVGVMLLPASDDPENDRRPKFGVIDYLVEHSLNPVEDADLYDFIGVSPFLEGSIDVIPAAGREIDERPSTMIAKLSRALVEDRKADRVISVTEQVRQMVDRFASRDTYDAILIDARAGLAEITAAPLLGLGAEILLFGIDQPQTFRGYTYLLAHLVSISDFAILSEAASDWRQHLSFVQSKAPAAPSKRAPFREELYELCSKYLYDEERLDAEGATVTADFAPGPDAKGVGVPHDALHIQFHPDYEAFDPVSDKTQLDPEVYDGPFGAFLERAWKILNLQREP